MVYVIGDRHGEEGSFSEERLPGQSQWTEQDVVIVTGDFGFVMRGEKNNLAERNKLNALERKPYTIAFCDGNHEAFPYLETYPEEIRFGAPVRCIRQNVVWLQRGYVYHIQGKTFFVMGGAYSVDREWRLRYQQICGEQIWFAQELPTPEEYRRAIRTLEAHQHRVDYIITHTAPRTIIPRIIGKYPDDHDRELTGFLDWVYHEVAFTRWYCGHFHEDVAVNEQMVCCYQKTHCIA